MTPTYQADVYLMVVTRSETIENTAAFDYTQAYSKLPTVPAVVGQVVSEYGIMPSSEAIEGVVNVEVPLNTPVFQIKVSTEDPEDASALANDLGAAVSSFVGERLAPGTGYRTVVVAESTVPQHPVSPDWVLNMAVGATLGLLVGGVTALLWDDLWPARKKRGGANMDPVLADDPELRMGSSKILVPSRNGYRAATRISESSSPQREDSPKDAS